MVWRKRSLIIAAIGFSAMAMVSEMLGFPPTSTRAGEPVTILLPGPLKGTSFGPWGVAIQRGYYKDEGLDVSIQTARGGADVAKQVGAGNALVGVAIADGAIFVRANGVPVKDIAVLGGGGFTTLMVRENSDIKTPADLKGKTITVQSYTSATYYALLGILAKFGLTKNDVNAQAVGSTNIWKIFVAGNSDAMLGPPDLTVYAGQAGVKVRVLPASEYFPSMAQALIASDMGIKEKPEVLRKVIRATLRSVREIMKDPAAAAHDYVKATPDNAGKEEEITQMFEAYNKYIYPGQKALGDINEEQLARLQKFYLDNKIIQKATPVSDLYTEELLK